MSDTDIHYLERAAGQRMAAGISPAEFKHAHILATRELEHGALLYLAVRALRLVEIFQLPGEAALTWFRTQESKPGALQW